jgi:hypothetical protein
MKKNDRNGSFIVVTSDEPWCDVWHTQLHYAYQLSLRTTVFYLGPPEPWRPSRLFTPHLNPKKITENLIVLSYFNLLPASIGFFALLINDLFTAILLKKYSRKKNLHRTPDIVWHFDSHRGYRLYRNKNAVRHIYHVIDPVAGLRLDNRLAASSDLVVVTSPRFTDYYQKLNKNVVQIGQGIDVRTHGERQGVFIEHQDLGGVGFG